MLDQNTSAQLKTLLERLEGPIELVATLDGSDKSAKIQELVSEVAALSDLVTARFDGINARAPSFGIAKAGEEPRVFFAGLPMGHEFTSLILALLQTSGYAPKVSDEVLANIKSLGVQSNFDVFVSLSCHNCPDVVQALNLIAIYNPGTTATMIDGAFFQEEVEERKIMAVPMVFQDNQHIGQGRMTLEEIIAKLDSNAATKDAEKLNAKDAFDVLVIGGGPAGNTSAIYAARKGIKTGIVAERMGGRLLAQSEEAQGSVFTLEIPLELHQSIAINPRPAMAADNAGIKGRKILLVEDNPVNQTVIDAMLSSLGYEVSMVSDGAQAIHRANTEAFTAILMDCRLPIIDGYEATRQIRSLQRRDIAHMPIIAMTANAFSEDVTNAIKAGMNYHLAKPIDIGALMGILSKYLQAPA